MPKAKLNKSQRRAFGRLCYTVFFWWNNLSVGPRQSLAEWFPEALTDEEKEEFQKLCDLSYKVATRWRTFAWKLEGKR